MKTREQELQDQAYSFIQLHDPEYKLIHEGDVDVAKVFMAKFVMSLDKESCCVRLEHTFWQMTEDQRVRYELPFTGISWWRCVRCGKFVQSM